MAIAQSLLDDLWDFSDPAGSEARLRIAARQSMDAASRAELETQRARAVGLQERYDEADAILDAISADSPVVAVRMALERGRLRNSSGDSAAALPLFRAAAERAASADLTFLRVDALHMLAIADTGRTDEWTTAALDLLEQTDDTRTLRWRVSLHSNAGWAHFNAGDFARAIAEFEFAKDAAVRWGTPEQIAWADEAVAEARAAF